MNLDLWRDLAGVLLILEMFIVALPVLVLLLFAVRGLYQLNHKTADLLSKAQAVAGNTKRAVDRSADVAASPVITLYALAAGGKGVIHGVSNVLKGKAG